MSGAPGPSPSPGGGAPAGSVGQALRPLWAQVYLPNLLMATGQGAMLPVLVYAAHQVHGSSAAAGALVAVNGLGTMAFDLPAGRIVARLGEWGAAWVAAVLLVAGITGCLLADSFALLALSVFVQAAGWAVWSLVRLSHLSRVAPVHARGRALSLFGGVVRAGNVLGPFAYLAVEHHNDARAAFAVYLAFVVVGFAWVVVARDRGDVAGRARAAPVRPGRILRDHRHGLLVAGIGALGVSILRGSRNAIVPLWAAHLGLDSASASMLVGVSSLVDLALFYPSGVASDRFGRRTVLLPCIVLLSLGHLLVPLSHSFATLFAVSFVLALGNGMGAGIVMTLGADLTPDEGRASFLSVWRTISDGGTATGPLVDAAVVALASLSLAGPVVGLIGLGAAAVVARRLEEPAHLHGRLPRLPRLVARRAQAGSGRGDRAPEDGAAGARE